MDTEHYSGTSYSELLSNAHTGADNVYCTTLTGATDKLVEVRTLAFTILTTHTGAGQSIVLLTNTKAKVLLIILRTRYRHTERNLL